MELYDSRSENQFRFTFSPNKNSSDLIALQSYYFTTYYSQKRRIYHNVG
jgi:hypothetical protein